MRGLKRIGAFCAATLFVAAAAIAAEHGADTGHAEHHFNWMDLVFRIVNFIIFAAILYKFAGKKIADFFGGRRANIKQELDTLESRRTEAQKRLSEVEKSIANLASERESILAEYKEQGERLKESIIEKANKSAEQIKEQAAMSAQHESKAAIDRMRAEIADLVVEAAEKVVADKLTREEQERIIDNYLTKVVLN